MSSIKYPKKITSSGPWLLGLDALEELHEIIEDSWTLMLDNFNSTKESVIQKALKENTLEDNEKNRADVEKRRYLMGYNFYREEKFVSGVLQGKKQIISQSLKELIY